MLRNNCGAYTNYSNPLVPNTHLYFVMYDSALTTTDRVTNSVVNAPGSRAVVYVFSRRDFRVSGHFRGGNQCLDIKRPLEGWVWCENCVCDVCRECIAGWRMVPVSTRTFWWFSMMPGLWKWTRGNPRLVWKTWLAVLVESQSDACFC